MKVDAIIPIELNVYDEDGDVVDTTTANLSRSEISRIIDQTSQLVLLVRDSRSVGDLLLLLEETLVDAKVIDK